jgi:PmbA protein
MDLSETMEKALDLLKKRSVSDFEIFGIVSDTIRAESKNAEVEFLTRSSESGISIRILMDNGMGFSYGKEAVDTLVDAAITSGRYQFRDEFNRLPDPQGDYPETEAFDKAVAAINPDECIQKAVLLERSARDADPRVENIRKASFSRSCSDVRILNSHGISSQFSVSSVSASLMVTLRQGSDVQSGYDFDFSHTLDALDVERVGRTAVERAARLLGARQLKTTKVPVLFDRTSTAELIEFIAGAFLGENVIKGKSPLKDRRGEKCLSGCLSLADDPLDKRAADVCPFDGEGLPSRKTELVRNGTVLAFLYDSYWARRAGTASTGNSVRGGYRSWPSLGTRHLCLEPGPTPMSEILARVPVALMVTDIMGMHTANPITGELSVGINGVLLEKGSPAFPVREAALSGNVYGMLGRVLAVGDEPRGFGHVLCPSMLVDAVDISSQ